jgi:hypothetical protein
VPAPPTHTGTALAQPAAGYSDRPELTAHTWWPPRTRHALCAAHELCAVRVQPVGAGGATGGVVGGGTVTALVAEGVPEGTATTSGPGGMVMQSPVRGS